MPSDPKYTAKKSAEPGGIVTDEPTTVVDDRGRPVAIPQPQPLYTTPIVLERKRGEKDKKRRRYTSGTKTVQKFGLGLSKAAFRTANSFAEGFETFSRRSSKSADRRRDGLVRDSLRNASSGVADGLAELGRAPGEIARSISGRTVWRAFRFFTFS